MRLSLAEKAFRRYRKDSFQHRQQKVLKHLVTKGFSFDIGQAKQSIFWRLNRMKKRREALARLG